MKAGSDERGVTLWETLIVVVMLMGMWAGMRLGLYGTHRPAEQASALSDFQAFVDQARAVAVVNGATLIVSATATDASLVQIYDGFGTGNVVHTATPAGPLALFDGTATYTAFSLAIKRDGSFLPYAGGMPITSAPLSCASLTIAVNVDGALGESRPIDCSDARFRAAPPSPSPAPT